MGNAQAGNASSGDDDTDYDASENVFEDDEQVNEILALDLSNITDDDVMMIGERIRQGNAEVHAIVAQHLVTMSMDAAEREKLINQGGLYLLSLLAASTNLEVLKHTAASFAHLAVNDDNRLAIVEQECLKPLSTLAFVRDDDVRVWAVWTLASLAEADACRRPLVKDGVLRVLYDLSHDVDVRIKQYVAAAMSSLAKCDDIKTEIVQSGGVDVCIDLARSYDTRVQSYAASALANISSREELRQPIVDAGGLSVLSLLGRSSEPTIQCFAAATFANLSKVALIQLKIVEEVGVPLLVRLLDCEQGETQGFAAVAITNLARNETVRSTMGDDGSIEGMVRLLRVGDGRLDKYAIQTLSLLARRDQCMRRIAQVGGEAIVARLVLPKSGSSGAAGPGTPARSASTAEMTSAAASASRGVPSVDPATAGMMHVLMETQRRLDMQNAELFKVVKMVAESHTQPPALGTPGQPADAQPMVPADEAVPKAELVAVRKQLNSTYTELDRVQQQCEALYKQVHALKRDLQQRTNELAEQAEKLSGLENDNGRLSATVRDLQQQLKSGAGSTQAAAQAAENIAARDQQITLLTRQVAQLRAQLETSERSVSTGQQDRAMLDSELQELREQLRARESEVANVRAQIETEVRRRTQEIEQRRASLEIQYLELERESKHSIEDVRGLRSRVKEQDALIEDLTRKYRKEMKERKLLFNRVQELQGNIRVYARVRPLISNEREEGLRGTVSYPDSNCLVVYDQEKMTSKSFDFERVFDEQSTQDQVFKDAMPLITSVMDGYNVCVFAYGQTGSGKTYTMEGPPGDPHEDPGVNIRALQELFRLREERLDSFDISIKCTMVEVYNEQMRDLLCDPRQRQKLELKQVAGSSEHYLPGVTEVAVMSPQEIYEIMMVGRHNRAVGVTRANEHSSRSHCVLQISVSCVNKHTGAEAIGKLNLVDLAGSERLAHSQVVGDAMTEAININKSLSALGDVIYALANKQPHVPYRNSKLTQLLQDSLSAESKALMFVQVSPNPRHMQESVCSLNFANRVQKVELGQAKKTIIGSADSGAKKTRKKVAAGPS